MKKSLIIILLAAVLLLSGCRIEYVITRETIRERLSGTGISL